VARFESRRINPGDLPAAAGSLRTLALDLDETMESGSSKLGGG